jgi:hypothetical protein
MPDPGRSPASLPLRWGRHTDRVWLGLALIVAGAVAIAGSSVLVLWLAGLGILAHVAGWALLPAEGWRRITAAAVATPMALLLLAGPRYLGVLVVIYLAWLLARRRPARAWLTALFPAAGALLIGTSTPTTGGMLPALGIMAAVLAASAWLAAYLSSGRFAAPSGRIRSRERSVDS